MSTPSIDRYSVIKSLGKGGMGEVFLAYDPLCKREIALKQILPKLHPHEVIKKRFLREAEIASKLSHPSIIPIFSIDSREDKSYYTMPYVEGETLKHLLKTCFEEEKNLGEVRHPIGSSLPSLVRIFAKLCEAVAYAHSKGIVHRDLKPDNVIVGTYGQVVLLDWGLADFIGGLPESFSDEDRTIDLTSPGKVPGTLNYIAPERMCHAPSHVSMDIYSLGVMLYQLLTLRPAFHRTSAESYRKTMEKETYIDPVERSPHRDVPQQLAQVVRQCLYYDPAQRFQSVDEIIDELKKFLEGTPEWIPHVRLDPHSREGWAFEEHVLLSKHSALSLLPELMQWMHLMLSHPEFSGNLRLQVPFQLPEGSRGVGLLIGSSFTTDRLDIDAGFCLWMGQGCQLFYKGVEISSIASEPLKGKHLLRLEVVDNQLLAYLDEQKIGHYISQFPLEAAQIGLLSLDAEYPLGPIEVSLGSNNAHISCLAIPDAFLKEKLFAKAQEEYSKIAQSFPDRPEGREALFKRGCALIEEARQTPAHQEKLLSSALEVFDQLRTTQAAPLEYLGKALVYKQTQEIDEEIKCFELALRKYTKHPLQKRIVEEVLFRLYATSSKQRVEAYHFALLGLRHFPALLSKPEHASLLSAFKSPLEGGEDLAELPFVIALYLGKAITLLEIAETVPSLSLQAVYALLLLGKTEWVEELLAQLQGRQEIECALLYFSKGAPAALACAKQQGSQEERIRCIRFILKRALIDAKTQGLDHIEPHPELNALLVEVCLWENNLEKAQELLKGQKNTLVAAYGCYLARTQGHAAALAYFEGIGIQSYPQTSTLLARSLTGKPLNNLLFWERINLLMQQGLYAHSLNHTKHAQTIQDEIKSLISSA